MESWGTWVLLGLALRCGLTMLLTNVPCQALVGMLCHNYMPRSNRLEEVRGSEC